VPTQQVPLKVKGVTLTCYYHFASYLVSLDFVEAKVDTSVFVYRRSNDTVYLLLYVGDIILIASRLELLQRTTTPLKREFAIKNLGLLHHFLGVSMEHWPNRIFLQQRQDALDIIEGMKGL
jgi:hypothetical protein